MSSVINDVQCSLCHSWVHSWCPVTIILLHSWCPVTLILWHSWCPVTLILWYSWCPMTFMMCSDINFVTLMMFSDFCLFDIPVELVSPGMLQYAVGRRSSRVFVFGSLGRFRVRILADSEFVFFVVDVLSSGKMAKVVYLCLLRPVREILKFQLLHWIPDGLIWAGHKSISDKGLVSAGDTMFLSGVALTKGFPHNEASCNPESSRHSDWILSHSNITGQLVVHASGGGGWRGEAAQEVPNDSRKKGHGHQSVKGASILSRSYKAAGSLEVFAFLLKILICEHGGARDVWLWNDKCSRFDSL